MQINENYLKLKSSYLFANIAKKVAAYGAANPNADIIRLGIGDVTRPLVPAVIDALHRAVDDMAREETFQGYPPELGQKFLLEAIQQHDFASRGVQLDLDEIFVSDGAKSDTGNIGDIFGTDNKVAICDPVYPVYVDTNVMGGRAGEYQPDGHWSNIIYLTCTAENDFLPELPDERPDIIYLCFPNNPTGMAIDQAGLKKWVDYARANESVILYDAAYEAFIPADSGLPHSIYEIEGAKECAIEFRSYSKTAGFTGVRCGYTVVPKALKVHGTALNALWARRQTTKFNGVSYITQRGAAAIYTPEGRRQIMANIEYYRNNARVIAGGLNEVGLRTWGAECSPYVWLQTPDHMKSWDFFDLLLNELQVVGTPGEGFGPAGEGYFRLTGFGNAERTKEAVQRIQNYFGK